MKIKICGLFRECDIDYVNEAKPDYVGFVFAESRRKVSLNQAKALKPKLNADISAAGVFVRADIDDIARAANEGIIDIIQLHGGESEDYIKQVKARTGLPVIKAISISSSDDILQANSSAADYLLLDSPTAGSGRKFDWDAAHLELCEKPFFLAGGINESNIDGAMRLNPYAIDISSGVETDGVKDKDKIIATVNKVRKYNEIQENTGK